MERKLVFHQAMYFFLKLDHTYMYEGENCFID